MNIQDNTIQGNDLSFSVYNPTYKQSYHAKSLGAYTETLLKHIYPALFFRTHGSFCLASTQQEFLRSLDSMKHNELPNFLENLCKTIATKKSYMQYRPLRILDICFGLGYNALLSLTYFKECEIYSPEKDFLLQELCNFPYHNIPHSKEVLNALHKNLHYKLDSKTLYFLHGDALFYLSQCRVTYFDIVFQDAFSQQYNPELWNLAYFQTLYKITATPCIITTYAKASAILQTARKAGFFTLKHAYGSIFFK